ncbi:hypothetical protein O0L34_g19211 [Tuta absoluta]|nr:hypothetical protein O0L34_g19211 [Tuta absoluta]
MAVCINCHILLRPQLQLHEYLVVDLGPDLVSIAEEWCSHEVTDTDRLCQECVTLLIRESANRNEHLYNQPNRQVGHLCVCIGCGISLGSRTGRRRHRFIERSNERSYIENLIFPRQVPDESWVCRACWMRAHENVPRPQNDLVELPANLYTAPPQEVDALVELRPENENVDPAAQQEVDAVLAFPSSSTIPSSEAESWAAGIQIPPQQEPRRDITLEGYSRTADTSSRCFVPGCENLERRRIPKIFEEGNIEGVQDFYYPKLSHLPRTCRYL